MPESYYVYVYIDPRNHEEFYYGKGTGSRKDAHLRDKSDTEKAQRIAAIKKEGLEPIIRVIARTLTESEAYLVEKTLLWKLGKWTTNRATGHFKDKFRPHNTLHKELPEFDYGKGFYYYNVGDNDWRNWDDFRKYGFISAGWGARYRDAMLSFNEGDVFAAYLRKHGFVGIGRITGKAKPIREIRIGRKWLLDFPLKCKNMADSSEDDEEAEYVCLVKWIKSVPREKAKWRPNAGLYTTQLMRASLSGQPKTIRFLEKEFHVQLKNACR